MSMPGSEPEKLLHVLLVEDDVRLAALIQEYLQNQSIDVSIEHRGDLACDRILNESPRSGGARPDAARA